MKSITLKLIALLICISSIGNAQNVWVQKADFPGLPRYHATGFTIGNKIYVATGWNDTTYYTDMWEYNTLTDTWLQKADLPATARYAATGFSIGGKGYICCGRSGTSTFLKDLWEYNPATDTWIQKTDFPSTARHHPVSFVIDTIAYVGTGENASFKKDMWAYNATTNTWTAKASFGGVARHAAVGFSTGNSMGYIGGGTTSTAYVNDFWQYNPTTNSWTALANFGTTGKEHAIAMPYYIDRAVIGSGWDGTSDTGDMWEYNFLTGAWISVASFGGGIREGAVGFAANGFGYMGTGYDTGIYKKDWWMFEPPVTGIMESTQSTIQVNVFPNPALEEVTIEVATAKVVKEVKLYNMIGELLIDKKTTEMKFKIDISKFNSGVYHIDFIDAKGNTVFIKKIVKE
jgi:N-acetylneuraminic acid mutarotase